MLKSIPLLFLLFTFAGFQNNALAQKMLCDVNNQKCISDQIILRADKIEDIRWKDQTYRDVAKNMASAGLADEALPLIDKIQNPDTKALTIRGIGMEAAMANAVPENLFINLRSYAEKITEPPSYGIALTYIAMAQAYAGDDAGAMQTASEMENEALRHKAYAETAEIQAEKGKLNLALQSILAIESVSFKNKAYVKISKILSEAEKFQDAYKVTAYITNPVMQTEALLFILDEQRRMKESNGKKIK